MDINCLGGGSNKGCPGIRVVVFVVAVTDDVVDAVRGGMDDPT